MPRLNRRRRLAIGLLGVVGLLAIVAVEVRLTARVRGAVGAYAALLAAANDEDLDAVRSLCSTRYLDRTGGPRLAAEGGLVGLPRSIDKNYRAWQDGDDVLICPSGRIGPVYRLIREGGAWRFDGPAGYLGPGR